MPDVVGIRFKRAGTIYYFDPAGIELNPNDNVVVETVRGTVVGRVVIAPKQVLSNELTEPLKPVVRKVTLEDLQKAGELETKEKEALTKCEELVTELQLPMKLLAAEYNLDASRLTILFSAEHRVDFRELVKRLAATLKTKIELRQVGARDEAKLIGGFGPCGLPLCCVSHLATFESVSVKLAKEQGLPLNPSKISGLCGRLLCCLSYESAFYRTMKEKMPKPGQSVTTPTGKATVVSVNPLKETVTVQLESEASLELPLSQVTPAEEKVKPEPETQKKP